MPWFVYIISCRNDELYTGITTDLERRLKEHQDQGKKCAKYLRGKAPLKCVFSHQVNSRAEALQIEHQIKKLSKSQKYALIFC